MDKIGEWQSAVILMVAGLGLLAVALFGRVGEWVEAKTKAIRTVSGVLGIAFLASAVVWQVNPEWIHLGQHNPPTIADNLPPPPPPPPPSPKLGKYPTAEIDNGEWGVRMTNVRTWDKSYAERFKEKRITRFEDDKDRVLVVVDFRLHNLTRNSLVPQFTTGHVSTGLEDNQGI